MEMRACHAVCATAAAVPTAAASAAMDARMRMCCSLRVPPLDSAQLVTECTHRQEIALRPGAEESLARLCEETFDLRAPRLKIRGTCEQHRQCFQLQDTAGCLVECTM